MSADGGDLPQPVAAFNGRIRGFTPRERADRAVRMAGDVVDLVRLAVSVHATNRIVNYSDRIASQVGTSFAANAFNDDLLARSTRDAVFDFKGQWQIAQRNAEAFWHGCTVKPLR